jgi:membrane associated rhomboid family serine protease
MRAPSRPPPPNWLSPVTDRLSPTITAMVVTLAVIWGAYVTAPPLRPFVDEHLSLTPLGVRSGQVWQLVTALFIHGDSQQTGAMALFFDLLGLWFVGATVERDFGRRKFLLFLFIPAIVANAVTTGIALAVGVNPLIWGTGPAIMALFVVFGRRYNRTPMRVIGGLVLEARMLVLLLLGLSVFTALIAGAWVPLLGELCGLALAYVMAGGRGAGLVELFQRLRNGQGRRRFQVVEGGRKTKGPAAGKTEPRTPYLN